MLPSIDLWIVNKPVGCSPVDRCWLAEPWPDDGIAKSGRSICCLHMSYLC